MKQKFTKVIASLIITGALMVQGSCTNSSSSSKSSPESMAKEVCDCYEKAKSYENDKRRIDEIVKCGDLMMSKLSTIQNMGARNDWSNEKVKDAIKRFDDIVEKCY